MRAVPRAGAGTHTVGAPGPTCSLLVTESAPGPVCLAVGGLHGGGGPRCEEGGTIVAPREAHGDDVLVFSTRSCLSSRGRAWGLPCRHHRPRK